MSRVEIGTPSSAVHHVRRGQLHALYLLWGRDNFPRVPTLSALGAVSMVMVVVMVMLL